jgi:uncharacterized protein (DUF2384 family)
MDSDYNRVMKVLEDRNRVRIKLAEFMTEQEISKWLHHQHPGLGHQMPTDVINRGGVDEVMKLVEQMGKSR